MSGDKKDPKGKAKGGVARAKSLTKEQRSDIAKKAAAARWRDKFTKPPIWVISKMNLE